MTVRFVYWGLAVFACVSAGLAGLAAGINLNPNSTVKFVPVLDPNTWSALGSWLGAIATFCAAGLALYYSRHDDQEKLAFFSEVHQLSAGETAVGVKMTLRVVCTGRLPTTILAIGIGVAEDRATFYPIARYTTKYETKKHLSRGETFEATVDLQALRAIAHDFKPYVGDKAGRLRFLVKTGLTSYREKFSTEAIDVLRLALSVD
jgi:hypothetical protein